MSTLLRVIPSLGGLTEFVNTKRPHWAQLLPHLFRNPDWDPDNGRAAVRRPAVVQAHHIQRRAWIFCTGRGRALIVCVLQITMAAGLVFLIVARQLLARKKGTQRI